MSQADAAARGARRGTIAYEPALDGIRGIAMIAIAGFHADIPWLSGSFLALDVFFVLSGYLITRLMLAEWTLQGGLGLRPFWVRRARRLLPAMLFALSGVAVFAAVAAPPDALARIRGDLLSTLFYFNNWWQIVQGHSYFDAYAGVTPLHHAWSLSLEEQWYVVWPLFVLLVLRRSRSVASLGWMCAGLALASAVWMAWLYVPGSDPSRVYYGTDTRAQEILVGAALACVIHLGALPGLAHPRRWARLGLIAAAALGVLWNVASHAAPWVYQGGMLLVSLLSAVVIVGASQPAPNLLRRLVGFAPFRWLGMISYGFYLWHLPVYLVLTRAATGLEGVPLFVLRLAATLVVAGFSYLVIERPIRVGALTPRRALAAALFGSLAVAMLSWQVTRASDAAHTLQPTNATAALPALDPELAKREPIRVLLVGDSVAWSLGNGFVPSLEAASGIALTNRAMPGCGLAHGRRREHGKIVAGDLGRACEEWPEHWARYVEETRPDVVLVLVGGWDVYDREVEGEWIEFGSDAYDAYLLGLLARADAVLGRTGARVVYLTAPYYHRENPASALAPVISERWRIDRFNAVLQRHLQGQTGDARATSIDLAPFVCVDAECSAVRDGTALRTDGAHFSYAGALQVGAWLAPRVHAVVEAGGR